MTWVTLATTSMVALAFLVPLGLLVQQLARERALADAERQAAVVVAVLAVTTDPVAVEQALQTADGADAWRVAVHGLAGTQVGTGHAATDDITLATSLREPMTSRAPGGLSYLEPVDVGGATVVVEVFVPDAVLSRGVHQAWYALAAVAVGLVLASMIFGRRLAGKVVGSMRALTRAAVAVGDGNLEVRVRPTGPREVAEVGVAFNRMADRLVAARIAERELVADLSHRLRTPLTVLRLDAETLDASDTDTEFTAELDRRRTAARIRHAIGTLEREIDELIRTTREAARKAAETGNAAAAASMAVAGGGGSAPAGGPAQPAAPTPRCDVSEVVRERMVFWSAVAGDQDRPCTVLGADTRAPVPVPRADLAAALDAVVGNVLRYTPQGTALEVAVSRRDGWVVLRVDDAGPGIPDPERAMRRGVSDHGSTGLGLDIARRVTQAAGGSVNIGRARLGGASVIMMFEDAEEPPQPASRFGLIGRLAREPRKTFDRRRR
ncbi:MAG: HAMP domain-containing histidine kinase [Micromonosporaceae bacterium]|nr:HAMP domain-containing histidine kinase [Micromonosporaceae bacterium]